MTNLKTYFDNLVNKYETPDFIKNDPVQFLHRFKNKKEIEIVGLVSSSLAYGKREKIIESIEKILIIIQNEPLNFCWSYNYEKDYKIFENFKYRYTTGEDIALLFNSISKAILKYDNLEELFLQDYKSEDINIKSALETFVNVLKNYSIQSRGLNHLLPSPKNGSACKRLNLFLKWMVRKPPVDLGIWKNVSAEKLIIPLDVHVAKISRKYNLTCRKTNDWITAEEITCKLKEMDCLDPVKYDYALFSAGIFNESDIAIKSAN
ncbi:MAG: TIGR02757 family protein [Candidatus Gastranaerophilales bacterium]|nr:TIGR02757 family protein [Candidatus Gastranaerophilales bacterium]